MLCSTASSSIAIRVPISLHLQNFCSFSFRIHGLRPGASVSSKLSGMSGSNRLLSRLSKPMALSIDKEPKRISGQSSNSDIDEDVKSAEIQFVKDDPSKIEAMTVQELRKMLRNSGLPAKGRKSELVSALKCFVDQQCDGEHSPETVERTSTGSHGMITREKKEKNISEEDCVVSISSISEVTELKQSKKRKKESRVQGKTAKFVAELATTEEEKLSLTTNGSSVEKSSRTRKVSSNISGNVPHTEPWTVLSHKKPQKGWMPYNPRTMRPPPLNSDTKHVKLMSWNVNGLRALLKLERFSALELAQKEDFDVLCLQETKLQEKDVESIERSLIAGYENTFWSCSNAKLGYSGTAIISRIKPLSVRCGLGIPDLDSEGRIVTAEFDSFYLVSGYVPNSGDGLKRLSYRITQWDPSLSNYLKELEKSKPVILTGDLNCAHQEIDIYNPAGNKRSAGFTIEERESFGKNFLSRGFVDTFRNQHPNVVGYTYWGYRHGGRKTNKGWRLDYFLVSESIAGRVHDSYIAPEVPGSDHCPIGLILKL